MKFDSIKNVPKHIFAIVAAILVAILSGGFGFYVNEYQVRAKLAIEHVGVKPLITEIEISPELRALKAELDTMDTEYYVLSFDSDSLKVFDDDKVKAYLESLLNRRKKHETVLKEYSSDLSLVTKMLGQENIDSKGFFKLASSHLKPEAPESKSNLSKVQVAINEKIQNTDHTIAKVNEIFSQLIDDVYKAKGSSSFQIDVILVNNGKTQSLLRNSGQISFGKDVIYLKKNKKKYSRWSSSSDGVLDSFIIIKENSFASMTLVIDEYNNRKRMLDLAKREYLSGSRLTTINLYDSKGKIILSKELLFRNDLEEERKVSLLSFIEENYEEYIPSSANKAHQRTP
jgi:hypothetical protein